MPPSSTAHLINHRQWSKDCKSPGTKRVNGCKSLQSFYRNSIYSLESYPVLSIYQWSECTSCWAPKQKKKDTVDDTLTFQTLSDWESGTICYIFLCYIYVLYMHIYLSALGNWQVTRSWWTEQYCYYTFLPSLMVASF